MPLLSNTKRAQTWRGLMRHWSGLRETLGAFSKSQLQDAIDATDQWIEDNQASYNSALPQPFRGEATQAQKTLMFCAIAAMRVSVGFARRLFGRID